MKKQVIQIISIILVVLTVLSVPTFAGFTDSGINDVITGITEFLTGTTEAPTRDFEDETTTEASMTEPTEETTTEAPTTEPTEETTTEAPTTEPTEPTTKPAKTFDEYNDNDKVAVMYICTQQVGLGHAWIYIENIAECELKVGCYDLKPDNGVSVGTFLLSRSDGGGVYYNVEAYCANKWGLRNQSWLKTELTKKQLIKVSDRIKAFNWWGIYLNCTFYAAEIWNCVSSKKIVPILFPFFVKWQILAHGGNKNVAMKPVEKTDCYKQHGFGKNARIVQVKDGTLDSKLF